MGWELNAFFALILFTGMFLAIRKLSDLGLSSKLLNFYMFLFIFIGFFIWTISTEPSIKISKTILIFLIIASIFSLFANFLLVKAIGAAPNPGYAVAIAGLQGVTVSIMAFLIFKSQLTFVKVIGIALGAIAIILISL